MTDAMAEDRGWTIRETYQEVVSGASIGDRPEMQRLLNDIKDRKWDVVIVVDISRLSRGDGSDQTIIANAFRLTGTRCYSEWKLYDLDDQDDLELFERKLQNSRVEYKAITKRLHRGVIATVSEGYACGGIVPYGLELKGPKRHKTFVKAETFPNVELMFAYFHDEPNPTWRGLSMLMHERGISSPQGKEWWSLPSLQSVIWNDTYIGYCSWGKHKTESYLGDDFSERKRSIVTEDYIKVPAKWPPFIDPEYVAEARARITKAPKSKKDAKTRNPLAGLLRCAKCGYVMQMRRNSGNGKVYFIHPDWKRDGTCSCKAAQVHVVLEMLSQALENDLSKTELVLTDDGEADAVERMREDIARMERDIERANKSLVDAYYRLDRGVIDEDIYRTVTSMEKDRIARLEKSIVEVKARVDERDRSHIEQRAVNLKAMMRAVSDGSIPPDKLNIILKEFIDRIEYTNNAPRGARENDIHLDIFLRS